MLYLITGAAGHLGSVVSKKLLERGDSVRALALPGEKNIPRGAEVVFGNVCDKESLKPFFAGTDSNDTVVIHCAGIVSIASKFDERLREVNVGGTKNIADLCLEEGVKRMVYVSTVHAIPERNKGETMCEISHFNPEEVIGSYAKTKSEASSYVLEAVGKGLDAVIVHPSGIVGPNDYGRGHLTTLVEDYCNGRLGAGLDGGYDFVDVRDVADGIISAAEKGGKGECYILSNEYFYIREIFEILHEVTGKRKIKTYLPIGFIRFMAPVAELYYKILGQPPLFTPYSIYTLTSNAIFSHDKASKELGYSTRDMRETIADTVAWLAEQGRV